jgi:DNA-binding NarL/FixJ family response regulator
LSGSAKVVVCDDHEMVRKVLIDRIDRIENVAATRDADSAEALLGGIDGDVPDLAVIDIELPGGTDGLNLTAELTGRYPKLRVLVLSAHDGADLIEEARESGARGFLSKSDTPDALEEAITAVLSGREWFPDDGGRPTGELERVLRLTAREREVLDRVGEGLKAEEIARKLGIKKATVYTHVRNAIAKLGVSSRTQAVALVTRYRYLDPDRVEN